MDLAFQLTAVILVLGGLILAKKLLQRRGAIGLSRRASPDVTAAARIQLTPQHSLHVVEFGGRRLLVAAHPSGCSVIDSASAAASDGLR